MDSIYSKPASSRLAWTQFTVNQLQAGLHGSDIQYITLKQACMARYTVYHAQTGLHGSDIQYISPKQACTAPIYSISRPNRLAWLRYTVYQPQAGLHGSDIQYIKHHNLPPKKKSPEQWTYHPCPGDFFMRSTVGAAYRRPPPLPPWRGGRLPRAAGSV